MELDNINFNNIDWNQYQNEIKEIKDCFEEIKKDKKLMEKLKEVE